MNDHLLVSDTTLLLYLGRTDLLDLLPILYKAIVVPTHVLMELDMGRWLRADTVDPRNLPWVAVVEVSQQDITELPPNRLGVGERAVLAYARTHEPCLAGLDDRMARALAEQLGTRVIGVVGILLKAKRAHLLSSIRVGLDNLRVEGFRISPELYQEAIRLAGEASS